QLAVRDARLLDLDPVAAPRARDRRLDGPDAAVAVLEGRERLVLLAGHGAVDLAEEVRERLAVALGVAGGIPREPTRRRVLQQELGRRVGVPVEELVGPFLVPGQTAARALALKHQLVLPAGRGRRQ